MCGIVGYTGTENARKILIEGLKILEYRGYDSAGIGLVSETDFQLARVKGRVEGLNEIRINGEFTCGIGHTRWATHGEPSVENAHPHRVGRVTLVHNGIIENYQELKKELEGEGVVFNSQTDTEVACALFDKYYDGSTHPCVAIYKAISRLKGSFAFALMFKGYEGRLFGLRHKSPLLVGKGKTGMHLASDLTALLPYTDTYTLLEEGEVVELRASESIFYSYDGIYDPVWHHSSLSYESCKKGGYDHYMLKEINEQPEAIEKTISPRINGGLPDFSSDGITKELFDGIKCVHIVGCGSAYNVGLIGARLIEEHAKISASAFVASEYRYSPPQNMQGALVIAISQSGETADTLASVRYARLCGCPVISVINARESSIARESSRIIYTHAGPEIAVATTKCFSAQLSIMYLFSVFMGTCKGRLTDATARELTEGMLRCSSTISRRLKGAGELLELSKSLSGASSAFFIGRGLDYFMCLEGALKLKEISYINAQAYQAGELKHGTISLIENGTPVISLMTEKRLFDKTLSNLKETKSRGASTVCFLAKTKKSPQECGDFNIFLKGNSFIESLFDQLVCLQLLSYHIARLRGCDIDKPRNLAKSVTVE